MVNGRIRIPGRGIPKWLLVCLAITCLLGRTAGAAQTRSVTLAWNPSPDPAVIGHYVHYGTASGHYDNRVDTGSATEAKVSGLIPGRTYYFTVTAYNAQRVESVPAGEIVYTVPSPVLAPLRLAPANAARPPALQFSVQPTHVYEVQASEDLVSWKTLHRGVSLSTDMLGFTDPQAKRFPKRFYRLAIPDLPQVPGWLRRPRTPEPGGSVRLRPRVSSGQRYRIEASDDFLNWTPLHEGVGVGNRPMDFVDCQAAAHPARFYRLALPDGSQAFGTVEVLRGDIPRGSRVQVAAIEGQPYRIEASSDLETWQTIHEAVATSTDPVDLVDPHADRFARRFYRVAFD